MRAVEIVNSAVLELARGAGIVEAKHVEAVAQLAAVSYVNGRTLGFPGGGELEGVSSLGFLPGSVISYVEGNSSVFETMFASLSEIYAQEHLGERVGEMREALLANDLVLDGAVEYRTGKNRRDTTGSYYTPKEFARAVVDEALTGYCASCRDDSEKKGSLLGRKALDPSCGTGDFLIAYMDALEEDHGIGPENSARLVWGIDLDLAALQTAACRVMSRAPKDAWREIAGHFLLGNPLVHSSSGAGLDAKFRLYSGGVFYSEDMGLDLTGLRFDVVIGNPPWEKIRFEKKKYLADCEGEGVKVSLRNERDEIVSRKREDDKVLFGHYREIEDSYAKYKKLALSNPFLDKSARGELNTYSLFAELGYKLLSPNGCFSMILKSAIVTTPACSQLFGYFLERRSLFSVFLFLNSEKLFNIDSREKYCVLTLTLRLNPIFLVQAGLTRPGQMRRGDLTYLTVDDVLSINPSTKMLPSVSSTAELVDLREMSKGLEAFSGVFPDCHFGRLLHLTAQAEFIDRNPAEDNLPITEGKMVNQYDLRFATFDGMDERAMYASKAKATPQTGEGWPKPCPVARYFVKKNLWNKYLSRYGESYSLCWRSLTSGTNTKASIAVIMPTSPTCQSLQILQHPDRETLLFLLGLFNSERFDNLVRRKMPGIDLTQAVVKQIPVPPMRVLEMEYAEGRSHFGYVVDKVRAIISFDPLLEGLAGYATKENSRRAAESEIGRLRALVDSAVDSAYALAMDRARG